MIGTDKHSLPFYGVRRPLICDLIVDNDVQGLEKYYGPKRVRRAEHARGGYEARDFFIDLNGRSRHLYFLAVPIFNEQGEIIGAVETLQDVTRERGIELSLKEHAETLQQELEKNLTLQRTIEGIIEGSPVPMFVIDRNHKVLYWNKAMAELSGYSANSMIGTDNQWVPFYPEKRPMIADLIADNDIASLNKYYVKTSRPEITTSLKGPMRCGTISRNLGGASLPLVTPRKQPMPCSSAHALSTRKMGVSMPRDDLNSWRPSVLVMGDNLHVSFVGQRRELLLDLVREDGGGHQVGRRIGEPVREAKLEVRTRLCLQDWVLRCVHASKVLRRGDDLATVPLLLLVGFNSPWLNIDGLLGELQSTHA